MRLCDLTLSYTETSGGIRTYIDQKRRFLLEHTDHTHVLIVPDEEDGTETSADGRATTVRIASPLIPGAAPYRFFWRPGRLTDALRATRPDAVELGSFYVCPTAAFAYREERTEAGDACSVGAYFHTDIAEAYVGAPLRSAVHDLLGDAANNAAVQLLESLGMTLAETAEDGMEQFVGRAFGRADLAMAASAAQAARLKDYGVAQDVYVIPLGADLDRFHPRHRSEAVRQQYGAGPDDLVLVYGGRLDAEKHVPTLLDAFERLPDALSAQLLLLGEGPLRDELADRAAGLDGAAVRPYETDPDAFAALLASADVYVTAGPHETFGLSVVEAQAAGLPVIGVDAGALPERVPSDDLGRLVPVDDADAFADAIEAVAADRDAIGRRARVHAEAHYDWDATFARWLALYERAVATHGGTN